MQGLQDCMTSGDQTLTKQWLLIFKKKEEKKVVEEPDFDLKW